MRNIFLILNVIFVLSGCIITNSVDAQSIPVGSPVLDDYYRRMQLLGKVDSDYSFSVRPILLKTELKVDNVFDPDTSLKKDHWVEAGPYTFAKGKGSFAILPFSWQQQINSDHPYGWNDGAMIPAKGYQTMVSGGFFFKYKFLTIQIRPEYVYTANPPFNGFASGHSNQDLSNYFSFYALIDNPERVGSGVYNKAFWGQSSIRLTFDPISVGISNENLWWGPGIKNALILTNNAAGFKHVTVNTIRPIKTLIGSFEGQILAGRLDNSGYPPLLTTQLSDGTNLFTPPRNDWRYFTGMNINFHPKPVPGLTIGFIRTFDSYNNDVKANGFSAYVPFLTTFFKKNENGGLGDLFPRDQITSLYARWLFPKAQAEIYFEYGLEDNTYNLDDFLGSPDHSRAYIFGFRKMLPIRGEKDQHILISTEITQTSQTTADVGVRQAGLWYSNYQVLQGHTNDGQVLGAGTGPGGNLQSFDLTWVNGVKTIGLSVERYEHNMDFALDYFPDINGNSRNWVDLAIALQGTWSYRNLLFNAKIQEIKSFNYEWILKDYNPSQYYIPHNDVYNLHAELGMTFRF